MRKEIIAIFNAMHYITIARILGIILMSIIMYYILLWICGRKIPGRLRKKHKYQAKNDDKSKAWIVLTFQLVMVTLISLIILLIKYIVRGEL